MLRRCLLTVVALSSLTLAGCDLLGIEGAAVVAERKSAEGKAIGAACRHAGRAIEDCYTLNKRAEKASIYAGWREMDDHMRENKLEPVVPQLPTARAKPAEAKDDGAEEAGADSAHAAEAESDAKPGKHARAGGGKAEAH